MYDQSWQEIENLAPLDRIEPPALELRLRILTATERWELGESIAAVLISSAIDRDKCLETCARFRHAYARALSLAGDGEASREQIRAAIKAWPEIRLAIVDDVELEALWEG